MIALLYDDKYYYGDQANVRDFLMSYAKYIGLNTKVFNVLARSEEMSIEELVGYINSNCYVDGEIAEIYEIGKKVY